MKTRSRLVFAASPATFGGSPTARPNFACPVEAKHRESILALRKLQVEQELEITVVYAIADRDGPLAGEIKIGVSSRKAYPGELEKFRTYRATEIVAHQEPEIWLHGKAEALLGRLDAVARRHAYRC